MKSLFFILLAAYAVRSNEDDYVIIDIPDDPPTQFEKPFKVYWNVPTMQCSSKKIYFDKLYEKFGIIQNDNDQYKGNEITILYDQDAGFFPAILKNNTIRNGGVPQEGDMDKHLDKFKKDLDSKIPDKEFNGIGIIDFEEWRPAFKQNFGSQVPHKDLSFEIEKKLHPEWNNTEIEAEAQRRFEEGSRKFMQTTLSVAKQLRPRALWGFYGFPYCFNMNSYLRENCSRDTTHENDQMSWLWSEATALYPSVYSSSSLNTSQLESLIRGRLREAERVARGQTILPYFWFRYRDAGYLSETDLNMLLATIYESNASGALLWGSSNDVDTVPECKDLLRYVETILGPAIAKYTKPPNGLYGENINITLLSSNNTSKFDLGPKYNVDSSKITKTSPQVDSTVFDISVSTVKTPTTEEIEVQTEDIETSSFISQTGIIDTVSEMIATDKSSVDDLTEHYYETSLYSEHDYTHLPSEFTDVYPISVEITTTEKIEVQTEDIVEVQTEDLDTDSFISQCVCSRPKGNYTLTPIDTSVPNINNTSETSDMSLILLEISQLRIDMTQQNFEIATKLATLSAQLEEKVGGCDKKLQAKDIEISVLKDILVQIQIKLISQERLSMKNKVILSVPDAKHHN